MVKIVFGCGYLGQRVAKEWITRGDEVHALTRSPTRALELAQAGIQPIIGDVTQPLDLPEFAQVETVLFAVGFDRESGYAISDVYVDGLARVLESLPSLVDRFIYISSTGVYGNTDGSWVDEDTTCIPTRSGGKACLQAEHRLRAHPLGKRAAVLRLAGIYGPGRVPRIATLQKGEPIAADPDAILNLIHVDDAVRVTLAIERQASLPNLFVIGDGHPVTRGEFYQHLSVLVGSPAPVFQSAETRPRDTSHKRVRTEKMHRELQIDLQFTDYRRGLAQIVAGD